jgi:hypothetical protein
MRRNRRAKDSPGPEDPTGLRAFIFGDRPIDEWPPPGTDTSTDSWRSFDQARSAFQAGDQEQAKGVWLSIANAEGIESRHALQAWQFLRDVDVEPAPEQAKRVLGAVAEVAVAGGHDLLAAYADGSVRYLNVGGAAVAVDVPTPELHTSAAEWLRAAQDLAMAIGPWEGDQLPPLPAGHSRLTVLTPSGPHFGQARHDALQADPKAAQFLRRATTVLLAVTRPATVE